jgi:long-chain fatty acid transport protein
MDWDSDADAFYMPAVGWAQKAGRFTYGFGAFAQGGMGTEYNGGSFGMPGGPGTAAVIGAGADASAVSSWDERSEVGVLRFILPLAYEVNEQLSVAGSLDYVRATLDLQMAMPASVMMDMMNPNSTVGSLSGSLLGALGGLPGPLYGGYFDFSDSSDYSGETQGDGFAGKLGVVYKVNSQLSLGATYHSKTSLSDLEGDATVEMAFDAGGGNTGTMPIDGKIKIKDFQWPSTYGFGVAYQASDRLMVAADVKRINWSEVMEDFKMTFESDMGDLDAVMFQDWDDQTVYQLGLGFKATDTLTVRAGANISDNPIPDNTVHYLFPAIIENHYTVGLGYDIPNNGDLNFSISYAPEVKVTGDGDANDGLEISHSQLNYQLMYSHRF